MSFVKTLSFLLLLASCVASRTSVLAQADGTYLESTSREVTTEKEAGSEVLLTAQELRNIVGRIQRARASRMRMQPMYYYAPEAQQSHSAESNSDLEARMARIEASLDFLIQNATAQKSALVPPQPVIQQVPIAKTSSSEELQLLQYELVQLRSELNSTRARLNERMLMQADSPAEERRRADQRREFQKQQDIRDRNARRESERLREEIRSLEKAVSKSSTTIVQAPSRMPNRVDTVVKVISQAPVQDPALVAMLRKQEAQLAALRSELAANEAARQTLASEPTIVYRDREVVRQADPIRVTDTLRIERTVERTAAPKIIDVSAVLFKVASSVVEVRNDNALTQAVESYRQRLGTVQLRGWSSPEGNPTSNRQLSLKRAKAVRDQLVLRGVPPTAIRILDGGIDTESISRNVARRVEIQLLIN